jgi:hypothetical protein
MIHSNILVDLSSLARSSTGQITGTLSLRFAAMDFPDPNWNDFVIIVLTWWALELRRLLNGETSAQLRFMDGPYLVELERVGADDLTVVLRKGNERMPLDERISVRELVDAAFKAMNAVVDVARRNGWASQDLRSLEAQLTSHDEPS